MMKRILLLLLLTITFSSTQAQKRRGKTKPVPQQLQLPEHLVGKTVEQALAAYDFSTAKELIEFKMAQKKQEGASDAEEQELLKWVTTAQMKMNAVEKVTFVDSIIVNKDEVLPHIHLSHECGKLFRAEDFFQGSKATGSTLFQTQLGDQVFYADKQGSAQQLALFMRDIYADGTSSAPVKLNGLELGEGEQNFPFMMTDGITLYFAAKGQESLGGYDIFMSRYDADEKRFLTPDNIGMPFNSPANDYLYVVDEVNHLGWFVTDRNMPEGKVCIYVFIPNEIRKVYLPEEMTAQQLSNVARITSIRDTWTDQAAVSRAKAALRNSALQEEGGTSNHLWFVVNDNCVYQSPGDFKTEKAQKILPQWEDAQKELQKTRKTLDMLRRQYLNSTTEARETLKEDILLLEQAEEKLVPLIRQQENDMRKAELGH